MKLDEITEQREQLEENKLSMLGTGWARLTKQFPFLKKFAPGTSRADVIKNLPPDQRAAVIKSIQGVIRRQPGSSYSKVTTSKGGPTKSGGGYSQGKSWSKTKRQQDAKIKADSAKVNQQRAAQDAKFAAADKAAKQKAEVEKLVRNQAERAAKDKRGLETARKNAKASKADDVPATTKGAGQVSKVNKADDVPATTKGAGQAVTKTSYSKGTTSQGGTPKSGGGYSKGKTPPSGPKAVPKTGYSKVTTSQGGTPKSGGGYSKGKTPPSGPKAVPKAVPKAGPKVNYIKPIAVGVGALAAASALAGDGKERKSIPLRQMIRSLGTPESPAVIQFESSSLDEKQLEAMIRNSAKQRGMDPDVAVRVWRSEGNTSYQSNIPRPDPIGSEGGKEASYGPFQLYTGGGLGNEYEEKYGVDLRKDNTPDGIQRQIDFALNKAVEKGWEPWKGAAKAGIGPRDGLDQAQVYTPKDNTQMATTSNKELNKLDPGTWVNDLRQGEKEIRQVARDIPTVAKGIYKDELKPFYKDTLAPLGKVVGTIGKEVYKKDIEPVFKKTSDYLNKKWQDYKSSGDGEVKYYDTKQTTNEKAPPSDKYERMVKDIKKGYTKDGKLTKQEKSIAYATAWKLYNKRKGKKS